MKRKDLVSVNVQQETKGAPLGETQIDSEFLEETSRISSILRNGSPRNSTNHTFPTHTSTLVSVKEAAKVVGMGAGSLYRLCKAGAVRSFKAGPKLSGVRVSIPELLEDLRRPALREVK